MRELEALKSELEMRVEMVSAKVHEFRQNHSSSTTFFTAFKENGQEQINKGHFEF